MNFSNPYIARPRSRIATRLGIQDCNSDLAQAHAGMLLSSGTVRYAHIPLLAGDIVSAVHFWVNVIAATVTTIKGGLYSMSGTTGTRLAVSNNTTTAFDALGLATLTMTTPYEVPTTGDYWVAVLSVATTPGTIMAAGSVDSVTGKSSGTLMFAATEGGQTDLDASSSVSLSTVPTWIGWS